MWRHEPRRRDNDFLYSNMSVLITDAKIEFKNPGNAGLVGNQKNFTLDIKDVKIVGLKFNIFWDNDEYYIVLIDSKGTSYILNSIFFNEESYTKLKQRFNLFFDIASFDYYYYKKGISIILYPEVAYGKPLFKNNISIFSRGLIFLKKLLLLKNPGWDYLSDESKAALGLISSLAFVGII